MSWWLLVVGPVLLGLVLYVAVLTIFVWLEVRAGCRRYEVAIGQARRA